MLTVKWSTELKYKKRYMLRDVLRAKVYTYGVWRMLEMLAEGERRGGRAPVCTPGAWRSSRGSSVGVRGPTVGRLPGEGHRSSIFFYYVQ